jgi:hypothetical protein
MLNKNILFLIISIFLGFIISLYYNKNIINFFIYFFLISSILYLIFYNLADIKYQEKFSNINEDIIRDYLEDYILQEEETIISKTEPNIQIDSNIQSIVLPEKNIEEEEIISQSPIENEILYKDPVEYEKPDLNKILLSNPLPLNINISYNSQNSINELENNKNETPIINKLNKKNLNKNLGDYNDSRINLNSDWIYGEKSWTTYPNYQNYIPTKKMTLNEIKKCENKIPSPIMINKPWSEYLSGDIKDYSPEPYNI